MTDDAYNKAFNYHGYDLRKIYQDRRLGQTRANTVVALIGWLAATGGGNIPTRKFAKIAGQAAGNIGNQFQELIELGVISGGKRLNVTSKKSWAVDSVSDIYLMDNTSPSLPTETERGAAETVYIEDENVGTIAITFTVTLLADKECRELA